MINGYAPHFCHIFRRRRDEIVELSNGSETDDLGTSSHQRTLKLLLIASVKDSNIVLRRKSCTYNHDFYLPHIHS